MKIRRIILFLSVLTLSGGLLYLALDYRAFLDAPLTVPAQGAVFEVAPGASAGSIASALRQRGILRAPWYWAFYARSSQQARKIKAGEYAIAENTTPRALLDQLVAGRVIQYELTLVEGWTFRQMLDAIARHDKLRHTLQGLDDGTIMAKLGRPEQHPEGRFFPDTYSFPAGTTDLAFLKRAHAALEQRLNQTWAGRVNDLPLRSPDEALVLASLIEKETGLAEERREIAGVFTRRLQRGMLLQSDPTVIYGLGESFDGDLRKADLRRDTPYNTYTRKGLPPTPIALVGAGALAAAVNPAPGDALYFVATGNGGHVFSATLSEHNRWVRRYQRGQASPPPAANPPAGSP